jgi:hypothetical protein
LKGIGFRMRLAASRVSASCSIPTIPPTPAFVQRLRELGSIENRTGVIEYRWAEGRNERFAEIAASSCREMPQASCPTLTIWRDGC